MNARFGFYQRMASRIIIPALLPLILFLGQNTANAASGKVFFNYSTDYIEVSNNFSANGTFVVQTDSDKPGVPGCTTYHPYWWDGLQGIGIYAILRYKIDGNDVKDRTGHYIDIGKSRLSNYFNDLGHLIPFSAFVDISGLDPAKEHEISVYLRDIFGYQCSYWELDDRFGEADVFAGKTLKFRIKVPQQCSLNTRLGSSANVNTGNLSDSLDLFSVKGNGLLSGVGLNYNSQNLYQATISRGWKHNYDYQLVTSMDGNMLLLEPGGSRLFYNSGGSSYVGQAGETSILRKNADNSFTLSDPDGGGMNFDPKGYITSMRDRYGNSLTFGYVAYDVYRDLVSVSDGTRGTSFDYDTSVTPHRLAGIRDPNQNSYALQYDGDGRLYRVVFPVTDSGESAAYWEYTYNSDGQLITKEDPSGNLTQYTYDNGKVSSANDPQGNTRSIAYPTTVTGNIRSSAFTEKDGGTWIYTYDVTTGRLKEKIAPDGSVTGYTHYSDGRDKSRTEPGINGIRYTTFYSYDANGNVITETEPMDCATLGIDPATVTNPATDSRIKIAFRYNYETAGQNRILSSSDVRGVAALTTSYSYSTDAEGYQVTSVTDPAGAVTITRQYPDGRTRDVTDANSKKTSYTYRADKQIETITDPAGIVTAFTAYDANGNAIEQQIKDSDGTVRKTVRMEYDARNRLRKSTTIATGQPDIVTSYGYDANDNMTTITDPEGNTTRNEYNYNRQVTKTTDANNKDTTYDYGATGCPSCGGGVDKLTAVTDAKSQATNYAYDQMGRLQTETDPLGKIIRYTYFENGKVKEKYDATTTPEKLLISYSYDSLGQLTGKQYADGTSESYTYDANGRIKTAVNANIGYSYDYYPNGRLQRITDNSGRQITNDLYDNLGQRTRITVKDGADQRAISYTYDEANRPKTITSSAGTFTYGYDKLGRRSSTGYPNGISATYSYDDLDRLTSLKHAAGATTIAFANYSGFDKTGNRKNKATDKGTESYSYDNIYRLLQAVTPKGTEKYTYDAVGNRLTGPGAKDTTYQYNAGNQMTKGRQFAYAYDNAGNQITRAIPNAADKSWIQTWDNENRLVKMEKAKGAEKQTVTFKYDPMGRRIEKKFTTVIDGITKSSTWTYIYDNDNIALEIYTNEAGVTEKTWYTHGSGTDEHLALERGSGYYYYHADGLGSITSITDTYKAVVQSYDYDSFGMSKPSTSFRNNYTYTGREWDKETGLYYYVNRYYDPMDGRFISKDPSGLQDEELNLYGYVGNNPINFIDPLGLYTLKPGVPQPSPEIDALLKCMEAKTKTTLYVTSTGEITKRHPANTPHGRGVAVDLRYPSNPDKVMCAAANCGAGYGQDEKKNPSSKSSGPHIHLQLPRGKRGGCGDLPPKGRCCEQ